MWFPRRRRSRPQWRPWVPVARVVLRVRPRDVHEVGCDGALERAQRRFRGA